MFTVHSPQLWLLSIRPLYLGRLIPVHLLFRLMTLLCLPRLHLISLKPYISADPNDSDNKRRHPR